MDELKKLPPPSPVEEPPVRTNLKMRRKQQTTQQVVSFRITNSNKNYNKKTFFQSQGGQKENEEFD